MTNMTKTTQSEKNIRNYFKEDFKKSKKFINDFKNLDELLNNWRARKILTTRQYEKAKSMKLKDVKKIIIEKLEKENNKALEKQLNKLQAIYNVEPTRHGKISVDWVSNRTWGACPRGNYANCFDYKEHGAITGCGYDKLSTLTAVFFNEDLHMLKRVVELIDKKKIRNNIDIVLGYGVRCHVACLILKAESGHLAMFQSLKN